MITVRTALAIALGVLPAGCSRAVAASVPVAAPAGSSCPAETHGLAIDPGFRSETPGTTLDPDRNLRGALQATVTAIAPAHIDLQTASATTLRFHWTGPALPFAIGDRVTFERADGWDTVRNVHHVAAAFRYAANAMQPTPPVDLRDGPSFQFSESCAAAQPARCAAGSSPRRVFALDVTVDRQSAHVLPGSTARVGDWQISNITSDATPACTCVDDCPGAFHSAAQVTILGPAPR